MTNCPDCGKYIDDRLQFGELIECPECHEVLTENASERTLLKDGKPMFKYY
jgi:hypothetical protein